MLRERAFGRPICLFSRTQAGRFGSCAFGSCGRRARRFRVALGGIGALRARCRARGLAVCDVRRPGRAPGPFFCSLGNSSAFHGAALHMGGACLHSFRVRFAVCAFLRRWRGGFRWPFVAHVLVVAAPFVFLDCGRDADGVDGRDRLCLCWFGRGSGNVRWGWPEQCALVCARSALSARSLIEVRSKQRKMRSRAPETQADHHLQTPRQHCPRHQFRR